MAGRADKNVLITGGAGFVGSNLALALAERHPGWRITALDNLHRRGSELNLPRLAGAGVEFVQGDVRNRDELLALPPIDALVECSAEPSALAGATGDTGYVVDTNLLGAHACLELARRDDAAFVFLSTSRVYPYERIDALRYEETPTRFALAPEQDVPGASERGIAEDLPLDGPRTLYGATKLAAELLVTEYVRSFGLRAVVDRCGVIAGPWQMGHAEQGVFMHWLLSAHRGDELAYIGYGGEGKQVRDLLHVLDLAELVEEQLAEPDRWAGRTFNVGGGVEFSLSLREASELCAELTGRPIEPRPAGESRPGDVRYYASDCTRLFEHTRWRPRRGPREVLADTLEWIRDNDRALAATLG